jgi:hypothetical protein
VRYWARSIDSLLIGIAVAVPFEVVLPEALNNRVVDQFIQFLGLALWIPIEAGLIAAFGCTPGKALLRIRVTNKNHTNLSFNQALSRSSGVWWKGLGTGLIPIVTIVMNVMAYRRLSDKGVTAWDEDGRFKVTHRNVGVVRALVAIAIFAGFIALIFAGVMSQETLDSAPQ